MDDLLGVGRVSEKTFKLGELIYPDIFKPSFQKVGRAFENVAGLFETLSLPIKFVNEASLIWFRKHMLKFEERMTQIPEDKVMPIRPDIAIPILNQLLYTEDDTVGKMFINLLVNGANWDTLHKSHPGYINALINLSPDEAKIIKFLYDDIRFSHAIPFLNFDIEDKNTGEKDLDILGNNKINLQIFIDFNSPASIEFYIQNFIRLGIFNSEKTKIKSLDCLYKELESEHIEDALFEVALRGLDNYKLLPKYYSYQITGFGKHFINACNE